MAWCVRAVVAPAVMRRLVEAQALARAGAGHPDRPPMITVILVEGLPGARPGDVLAALLAAAAALASGDVVVVTQKIVSKAEDPGPGRRRYRGGRAGLLPPARGAGVGAGPPPPWGRVCGRRAGRRRRSGDGQGRRRGRGRELNNCPSNYWIFTDGGPKRLIDRTGWELLHYASFGDVTDSDPVDRTKDERAFCLLRSRRQMAG